MTVRRPTYRIELADGSEHVVEVIHGDQLRAELEAPRHAIPVNPNQLPLATTTLWLWAACTRLQLTTAKFQPFKNDELVAVEAIRPDDGATPDQPVDPTQQDQGTPAP